MQPANLELARLAAKRVAARVTGKDIVSADNRHYLDSDGIIAFARDILHADPAPYQEEILCALVEHHRVSARGPHGLGKTAIAAWAVLWGMAAFPSDVKIVTTASAWRQLTKYLWPEIHKWALHADWERVGLTVRDNRELLDLSLKLSGKEAFAVASDNSDLIEGAHASHLIYIFDEGKSIPVETWDAAEGAFATGDCYALAISTPGAPSGRFYDIHTRQPGLTNWWTRHVTVEEAIAAGRINPRWVADRKLQWGERSAVYQNRVLGEFADSEEDSVIPLSWIEQANERWRQCDGKGEGGLAYGADPARFGTDQTGLAKIVGVVCEWVHKYPKQDTMQTAGRLAAELGDGKRIPVGVDTIGIGAGVYDRLRELGYQTVSVNVAQHTTLTDRTGKNHFTNLRSALWWMVRDWLDPANDSQAAIPPDDNLTGDLTAPTWTYTSAGAIQVEGKETIRERIGRSTDSADALAIALYAQQHSNTLRGDVI